MTSIDAASFRSPIDIAKTHDPEIPETVYFQSILDSANGRYNLFIDVTDYVLFFTHRARVSGIQRVVHSLLKYLDASALDGLSCILYCITHPDTGLFGLVSPSLFSELFRTIDLGKDIKNIHKQANSLLKSTSFRPYLPLTRQDCLLIPGGPWVSVLQLNLYCLEKKRIEFSAYCVCYDLIPIDFPEFCSAGLSRVFKQTYAKLSELCEGFISISSYSSECIKRYEAKLGLNRLPLAYQSWRLGDYDDNFSVAPEMPPVELKPFIDKITKNDFLLVVSTVEPRKNHQSILRAWRLLLQEYNLEHEAMPALVFAGAVGWISNDLVEQINSMCESGISIFVIENLSDSGISWLYQNCIFSIMPSFVEGWGLSIPESLMRGKVCLASETSSMKEASFGIAPLFDPYNIRDLAAKTYQLLYGNKLSYYEELLKEYNAFSWRESALQFYQRLGTLLSHFNEVLTIPSRAPFRIDVNDNAHQGLFLPAEYRDELGETSDWFSVSADLMLNAFSTRPSLSFKLTKRPDIVKLYVSHYSLATDVKISVYNDLNMAICDHCSAVDMGSGQIVHYLHLNDPRPDVVLANIYSIKFEEGRPENDESFRPCVDRGPLSWFGIKRIEFCFS